MTDMQVLVLACSIVIPLSLLLLPLSQLPHSNSRITDAKDAIAGAISDLRTDLQRIEKKLDRVIETRLEGKQ
jgi:hypothetical protein